jgi:CHAT domain-containing protein/tetratricopeptide (TPR) repeat protein
MRSLFTACTLACLLAGCALPPPGAYIGGNPAAAEGAKPVALGSDASGESCNQLPSDLANAVDVYCGTWQLPAAHIRFVPATTASPVELASGGAWRDTLELRYACAPPVSSSILDGVAAALLQCTRRIGGWPQVALVASVGGRIYLADGILPTLPVMERAIGVLSGRATAGTVALLPSAVDALLAGRLAARAFSAGDVGDYERLMALGARANLAESFATAETADRAALALQQKALGRNDPDTVNALMHLALQVSDQGRFAEADTLFQQADTLAPHATDEAAPARLLHYRGLHALNQGHTEEALALLTRATAAYASLVPRESLRAGALDTARPVRVAAAGTIANEAAGMPIAGPSSAAPSNADVSSAGLPSQRLMVDPTAQSALIGLIETLRYRAIALRLLGRSADSAAVIASAEALAAANRMEVPLVSARLTRTAATTRAAAGDVGVAEARLARSQQDFTQVLPQTRPVAETELLQAADYVRQGKPDPAIALCDQATALLRQLRVGIDSTLLEPCLASEAASAERDPSRGQALLARMFETAQLGQGSVTSRQIGEAAARLAAGTHDPMVAEAIRRRQDAAQTLAELFRRRDALAHPPPPGTLPPATAELSPAELDKRIAAEQAELGDADAALQAAAPNYGQLVQQVVPAADVLHALAPGEAFAAITLTGHGGWTFLFRSGMITAKPVHGDEAAIAALVRKVRAGIEMTTDTLPTFDVAASQALYNDTLGAVAPQLSGAQALVVAPSGPLLALPFAVLLTGPASPTELAGAPWLIRQVSVAHVPSAANFVALRKAGASAAPHPWLGFGGFRPVTLAQARASFPAAVCRDSAALLASLPPLDSALRELNAARQVVGASPSDEILNANFTVPAVEQADLKDYRILHFATHALLPAELRCEDEPAIVTSAPPGARDASGALLTASDIVGLHLDADLAILSACNSGGPGGAVAGESLSGLARAFFYAGARSLLVTHWSVNDQAAAYLVVDTLSRLRRAPAAGVAAALRGAELGMLDAAGHSMPAALAHPYFWAPFAVIGDGSGARQVAAAGRTTLAAN